ncbi:MAG: hypothetical protein WC297_03045 [Candidatus Paceibacterota bacterium]|jgi:hypothetical protein
MKVLGYVLNRFFYQITDFFNHWYVDSFYVFSQALFSFLEGLDRFFAFKITIKHFFNPLYQDRTVIGYTLGFVFRLVRVLIGFVFYVFLIVLFLIIYLAWLAIPLFIIYQIFKRRF